jgi:hypothetical protein
MWTRIMPVALAVLCLVAFSSAGDAQGNTGKLKVKADPGRAGVFVDGKYLGPAANFKRARTYTLPAGSYDVVLRDPRYREAGQKVTIEAGETTTIERQLEPLPEATPPFGKLKTKSSEKYTAVYVNGAFMGHADEFDNFAQGILIRPGEYQVRLVSADGARSHEEKVTVRADETSEVRWIGQ